MTPLSPLEGAQAQKSEMLEVPRSNEVYGEAPGALLYILLQL